MTNVAPRVFRPCRGYQEFPESNVRTYVRVHDRPGTTFQPRCRQHACGAGRQNRVELAYFSAAMTVDRRRTASNTRAGDRMTQPTHDCRHNIHRLELDFKQSVGRWSASSLSATVGTPRSPGCRVPAGHSSPTLAAAVRGRRLQVQHDGQRHAPLTALYETGASLLEAAGHGCVAANWVAGIRGWPARRISLLLPLYLRV